MNENEIQKETVENEQKEINAEEKIVEKKEENSAEGKAEENAETQNNAVVQNKAVENKNGDDGKKKKKNEKIQAVKQVHPEGVCLFKAGTFYHTFGRDSYVLSYIFKYKLRRVEKDMVECGFPVSSLNKVMKKFEDEKIDYYVIDNRNEYHEDYKNENKDLNRYKKVYERARIYVNHKARVDAITLYLNDKIEEKDFRKTLGKIEEVIYETGEV